MKVLTDNQHYQDIAEAILAKTGSTTPLKPGEMAPALNDLNIELMETHVTSTEEEQVIYPDEGYYGFSKITVGAVDLSGGGSGSGGTGEEYPDAESTTFGSDFVIAPVTTGFSYYKKPDDTTSGLYLPDPPAEAASYPYQYIDYSYSGDWRNYFLFCSTAPIFFKPSINGLSTTGDKILYRCTFLYSESKEEWAWELQSEANFSKWSIQWWSQPIGVYSSDEQYYSGFGTIVPETVDGQVALPVEREETYTVSGDSMNAIASAAQRLTGYELMTPAEIAAALNALVDGATSSTE